MLDEQPAFFPHLAQNSLLFKPPFSLFGKIFLSTGSIEHDGHLNLKDSMLPLVSFARLYALQQKIDHTHTLERIEALAEKHVLLPASRDEIVTVYEFLLQLRLRHQLAAIQAGQPPDNIISPGQLGHSETALLKQAFAQIAAVQKKINYEFLGGA